MPSTRSSTRPSNTNSSPASSPSTSSPSSKGLKRKASTSTPNGAGASPAAAKRGRGRPPKEKQISIEQSMGKEGEEGDEVKDEEMKDGEVERDLERVADEGEDEADGEAKGEGDGDAKEGVNGDAKAPSNGDAKEEAEEEGEEEVKDETKDDSKDDSKNDNTNDENPALSTPAANGTSTVVKQSSDRAKQMPSNILEKGIFYFFSRPRVGIDNPTSVSDIARSHLVFRALPLDAKLNDAGPLPDAANLRLLAIPKKTLPVSPSDRFMVFVEKPASDIKSLKEEFLTGTEYETQGGTRQTKPAHPIGEGVYAITQTGRDTHLAYILTIPSEIGEVQKSVGLAEKGSFVLSTKNPQSKGPANAQLDKPAEFPDDIQEAFGGRNWMPTQPSHLNHANAQFLLIGEGHDEFKGAVEAAPQDEKAEEKRVPEEELEALEEEDEQRAQALGLDASVYKDLAIYKEGFPAIPSTWE